MPALDSAFSALSDATRRGILERLGRRDASISDLADRFEMTLTGIKKHVRVLEEAGEPLTTAEIHRRLPGRKRGGSVNVPPPGGLARILHRRSDWFRQLPDGRWTLARGQ